MNPENIDINALNEYHEYLERCWTNYSQMAYEIGLHVQDFTLAVNNSKYEEILKHIHYKRQLQVEDLLKNLELHADDFQNTKIIIFGSSTNAYCTDESDIDIAFLCYNEVDYKEFREQLSSVCSDSLHKFDVEFDLVNIKNTEVNTKLIKAINRGVVIWDKNMQTSFSTNQEKL